MSMYTINQDGTRMRIRRFIALKPEGIVPARIWNWDWTKLREYIIWSEHNIEEFEDDVQEDAVFFDTLLCRVTTQAQQDFLDALCDYENIKIDGMRTSQDSSAVLVLSHLWDHTQPEGLMLEAPVAALNLWQSLSEDDRQALFSDACCGKLD